MAGFAFSKKTTEHEAVARLVGILDSIDAQWRDYVRVWDGWGRDDDAQPQFADPPLRGTFDLFTDSAAGIAPAKGRIAGLLRGLFRRRA